MMGGWGCQSKETMTVWVPYKANFHELLKPSEMQGQNAASNSSDDVTAVGNAAEAVINTQTAVPCINF